MLIIVDVLLSPELFINTGTLKLVDNFLDLWTPPFHVLEPLRNNLSTYLIIINNLFKQLQLLSGINQTADVNKNVEFFLLHENYKWCLFHSEEQDN